MRLKPNLNLENLVLRLRSVQLAATNCILVTALSFKPIDEPVISPARLDGFRPNFAGRRIEAINMFPICFNL